VSLQPVEARAGYMSNFFFGLDFTNSGSDTPAFPVSWGVPFAGWHTLGNVYYGYDAAPKRDDAMQPASLYVGYYAQYADAKPVVGAPIHAELSPVRAATVNGADLAAPQKGFGVTPTLAWQAPATGTATHYEVRIYHLGLDAAKQKTVREYKAGFLIHGTSLTLPAGVLTAGEPYVIVVASVRDDVSDLAAQLWVSPGVQTRADFASAVLIP
jgi:hypothetical protein